MSSIKKVVCSVAIGAMITKKAFASQVIQSHNEQLTGIRSLLTSLHDTQNRFDETATNLPSENLNEYDQDGNEIIENKDETDVAPRDESVIDGSYPDESVIDDSYADQSEFDLQTFIQMIHPEFAARMETFRSLDDSQLSQAFEAIRDIFPNLDGNEMIENQDETDVASPDESVIDGSHADQLEFDLSSGSFGEDFLAKANIYSNLHDLQTFIQMIDEDQNLDESQAFDLIMNEIPNYTGLLQQFVPSMNPIHNQPGSEQSIDDQIRTVRGRLFAHKDAIERLQHSVEGAFNELEREFTTQKTLSEAFANVLMKHHTQISLAAAKLDAWLTHITPEESVLDESDGN